MASVPQRRCSVFALCAAIFCACAEAGFVSDGGTEPAHDATVLADARAAITADAAVRLDAAAAPDAAAAAAPDASDASPDASAGDATPLRPDAAVPPADAAIGCGEFTGDDSFTCAKDGDSRGECVSGSPVVEACDRGCLRRPSGQDSVCLGTTNNFSCTGSYGTTPAGGGDYYLTSFGCWVDATGGIHTDPGDNCIPSCLGQAKAAGLCEAGDSGPACEERLIWFTADGARFGCLARLRVTEPTSGKAVIAVALDYGPSCSVERSVSKTVLDASGRVDRYLFGSDQGASDRALVHVVEVDRSTPLGPVP
jgi:hypothetical protein